MTEKTKKLSDRVREVLDALVDAVEGLFSPPPAPVPVRVRQPRLPTRRRR
ncbi:MAG: hypothetical protein JRD92_17900 [Deltaproteobacteria bacterium]|nr:hypothetical protein [Deltaproteobacteria bacterium]